MHGSPSRASCVLSPASRCRRVAGVDALLAQEPVEGRQRLLHAWLRSRPAVGPRMWSASRRSPGSAKSAGEAPQASASSLTDSPALRRSSSMRSLKVGSCWVSSPSRTRHTPGTIEGEPAWAWNASQAYSTPCAYAPDALAGFAVVAQFRRLPPTAAMRDSRKQLLSTWVIPRVIPAPGRPPKSA